MPGDTEEGFPAYGNVFFKEVINRGAQLKLSYIDLGQSDFDGYYHIFFSGHIHVWVVLIIMNSLRSEGLISYSAFHVGN